MKRAVLLMAISSVVLAVVAPAAFAAKKHKTAHYYLALGDSLSVGYQPNASGVGVETNRGYTKDLVRLESKRIKNLKLVQMGCPGDTTSSLLTGQGNSQNATKFHCDRKHGSQLKAAVAFLKAHHKAGEVPLVTIDIGANDVDSCASESTLAAVATCVNNGEAAIKANLPKILQALKAAAPKRTTLVGMNLYDPVLGEYFSANPNDKTLAEASVAFLKDVNGDIASADSQSGFKTADVADAFHSYDQSPTVSYEGQMIPVDVAYVCGWTWACTTPPVGPNIHANDLGYGVIADVFRQTAGRLR